MDKHVTGSRQTTLGLTVTVLLGLSLLATLGPATGQASPPPQVPPSLMWSIQRVDAPHRFFRLSDRSMAVDSAGHPHVAYGRDFLYYAWHDGAVWHNETVDASPWVGRSTSVRLDDAGRPHIAYSDGMNITVKYAHHDGTAWRVQSVDRGGPPRGTVVSLALDTAGQPHLAYCSVLNDLDQCGELRYAHLTGTTWITDIVATNLGYWENASSVSLDLDSSSHPHIAYYDFTLGALRHAYHDGSAWQVETVVSDFAQYVSLALDTAGHPHIGFHDTNNFNLGYAYYDGTTWHVESAQSGWVGRSSALTLDPLDRPHLSYTDSGGNVLYYTYHDGENWQVQTVTTGGAIEYTSVALDPLGLPHIAYYHDIEWAGVDRELKYARYDGADWLVEMVDREGTVGDTSLALDQAGRPHTGYCDALHHDLYYSWNPGAAWQRQRIDRAGTSGCEDALALGNDDLPHLAYQVNNSLRHAWSDGTTWFTETAPISWPWSISLAVDTAGHPHTSYITGGGSVGYAWYDGTTWHQETAATGFACSFTSLALDAADRPHIAYACGLSGLRYVYLSETVWITATADSSDGAIFYASLALDQAGRPHIGYCVSHDPPICDDLRYAWFDGTAWYTATVESAGAVGGYVSLALDTADRPHLSYCLHPPGSSDCDDLRYAWFDGTLWYTETVDSSGNVGLYTSLALDGAGRPHISYSDDLGDLKYARQVESYRVYLPLSWRGNP